MSDWLRRYRSGDHEEVWEELVSLSENVRKREFFDDALGVARDTMARVHDNVVALHARLQAIGYQFEEPTESYVPPPPDTAKMIEAIQEKVGPIPLSLRAFYEIVGS